MAKWGIELSFSSNCHKSFFFMGKLAKQKKRKAENGLKTIETIEITGDALKTTIETLTFLVENKEVLQQKEFKLLRKVLFNIQSTKATSLTGEISDSLREGRFEDAIAQLTTMRTQNKLPKLGSLCRWVRECDAAGESHSTDNTEVYRTLDAILRTSDPDMVGVQTNEKSQHPVRIHPSFQPGTLVTHSSKISNPALPANLKQLSTYLDGFETTEAVKGFKLVYKELGSNRMPPNLHDMNLYQSNGKAIIGKYTKPVTRIDVPNLPGVFILKDVLSKQECTQIIAVAETIGFTPDIPIGGSAKDKTSILAHNFFWLCDDTFLGYIYNRCQELLPQIIGDGAIAGLNSRWRVYRYTPGSIYRPHMDGAWPGSGITLKGEYVYDAYGDRWSKLTFLIRLNDNFKGGATTYFTPSVDVGYLDALPICPLMGDVLVFPHGDTKGTLLHEGSAVIDTDGLLADAKYVIRTEVLYTIPGHQRKVLD
jgi:hypothetical protein